MLSLNRFYSRCCGVDEPATIQLAERKWSDITEAMILKVFEGKLKEGQIEADYYFSTAQILQNAIKQGLGLQQGQLSPDMPQTKLFERFNSNIFAFSGAKSLTALQEYKKRLTDEKGDPVSYGQFRQSVTQVDVAFNDNYLQTEYKSAIGMAQMANKWQQLQEYDMLEYRTVGDHRVRKSHKKLDGVRLPPSDPLWSKIYPPNDWNCRCTAIPVQGASQNKREEADAFAKSELKPYFRRNSGTEQVAFAEDHPYFSRTKHDVAKGRMHQFMAEENYGMRSVEQILKSEELPKIQAPASKAEAQRLWEQMDKTVTTADGLSWTLNDRWEHVVEQHGDENRWQYISKASEVIGDADEVWTTIDKGRQYKRYIKYYHGNPIVFSYEVDKPEDWTIYSATPKQSFKNIKDRVRRGVLIFRK